MSTPSIEYRFVGQTGLRVSSLVAGTMAYGGDADAEMSASLFARCLDAGINTFDCADVYAGGESERILGKLIAPHRDSLVLASKAYFPTGSGPNDRGGSRYHLISAVEASLRRLGTDRIDLFFLHRFDDATSLEETLRGVESLVASGKILYPAVSNFAAWQTTKALGIANRHGWAPVVATQPMYNLLKRQAESEILPMARSEKIAVFSYSPLAGGLLSGKYGRQQRPPTGRIVDNHMYTTRYGAPSNFEIAERFTALAEDVGVHPATLAIAWVASRAGITAPIVGARNLQQLEPCLAAAQFELSEEIAQAITALSPAPAVATDRNEESSAHNYGSR